MQCTISEIARRAGISKAAIIKARNEGRLPESLFTLNERGITCIADDDLAERVLRRTIGLRISSTLRMPRVG
ncbi:hypothetical protein [Pseudomonas putida]|jgi:hypothetical protein|uniref:hypothetical protein n=1 Tax=Pseudomonas putida TaxID=303 RepID=UPI00062AFA2B|nr:hypothetical protein [Pseudomonas putida]KKX57939.1 hypothetical protein PU99_28280 [Pseudomonas putida]